MKKALSIIFIFFGFSIFADGQITGSLNLCTGAAAILSDAVTGGTWSSGNTAVAIIGSSNGYVSGMAAGTASISYTTPGGTVTSIVSVNQSPAPISGITILCSPGASVTLTDLTTGGAWTCSGTGVATAGSVSGVITAVSAGVTIVSYSMPSGCSVTAYLYVGSGPTTLLGCDNIGVGDTLTFPEAYTGVYSSNYSVASPFFGGAVVGISPGTATISLVNPTIGCTVATRNITVTATTLIQPIGGSIPTCAGDLRMLTDTVPGGTWSSGNSAIATVNTTGVVSAVSGGETVISYTAPGGLATCTIPFIVNSLPHPFTGPTSVCAGDTISLSSSPGLYRATTIYGDWYGLGPIPIDGPPDYGGVFSSSDTNKAKIVSTLCNFCYTIDIKGITEGTSVITFKDQNSGCSISTTVTVNTTPMAGTITGSSSGCVGAASSYTDTVTGGIWTGGIAGIATVGSTGIVSGISAGTAVISYSVTNSCGSAFATKLVTVNPLPDPGIIVGTPTLCVAATDILGDPTVGGAWSSTATSIAVAGSAGVVTGVSAGTSTIDYAVTNSCGTAVATKLITVNPLPVAGAIGVPAIICPGLPVTLTETISGGVWSSSDLLTASVGPVTGIVTGIDSGSVVLNYMVTNSCGSATTHDTVAVHALPYAGVITGSSTVCNGSSIVLSDTVAGGIWSSGTAASVAGGIVTGVIPGADSIKYSVSNICGVATASKIMTIEPLPPVHSITGGGNYCSGGAGADIGLSGSDAGVFYQLLMGIVPVSGTMTGTGGSLDFGLYTTAGVYTILATNSSTGCNNNMAGSDTITVTPTTTPSVTITANPALPIGIGESDTLTATVTGGGATPTYQWYKNGIAIPGANTDTYINSLYFEGDSVSCEVMSSEVCGTSASADVIITLASLGVTRANTQEQFVVYPNPNNGVFTANLFSNTEEPVEIVITNIVGEKVKEVATGTNRATEIKLAGEGGVYFVCVSTASGNYVVKVVVND